MTVTKFLLPKKTQITLIQLAFTYSKQTMETPEKSPKSEIVYCSDVFTIDFKTSIKIHLYQVWRNQFLGLSQTLKTHGQISKKRCIEKYCSWDEGCKFLAL